VVVSAATGAVIGQHVPFWPILSDFSVLGDLNGDGLGDLGERLAPFQSTCPPTCPPMEYGVSPYWPGVSWPPYGPPPYEEWWIWVAKNLRITGPVLVGGTATFDVLAPKFPGRLFQLAFSLTGAFPGTPLGPFRIPLVWDSTFMGSLDAGIGGVLDASGKATLALAVPPDPGLQNLVVHTSGVVFDSAGALGIGCVLTREVIRIQ
jgi:hypothetical protein